MTTRQRYIHHKTYGVGYAILTRYRKDSQNDLWMVEFYHPEAKGKSWYCTKDFTHKDEVEFITDAQAKVLRKNPRTKTVRKREKNIGDILDSLFQTR